MKKIVIDARESGTSTGRYIDKLLEYLHKLNPDFEITVLTKTDRLNFFKQTTPNFKAIESPYKEFGLGEQFGLARQLYDLKPDLIHFNAPQQPVLYFGRTITTVHDLTTARFYNPSKNWLVFKLKQLVYRCVVIWVSHKSKFVITPSEFVKKDLSQFARIKPTKINVTYEAADKIVADPEPVKELEGKKFLMYVGRPTPHKNLERLVEAFEKIRPDVPDLHLALIGKTDLNFKRLEKYVADKSLTNQVIFTGFVSDAQLRWLYENCQVYVFPSLSEGFGLPGLEAMAQGAPVISSNATCLPEIYGNSAVYFDPLNVDDIASKIKQVISEANLRQQLIQKGLAQAAKYSWQTTAQQTLDVYKKTLRA